MVPYGRRLGQQDTAGFKSQKARGLAPPEPFFGLDGLYWIDTTFRLLGQKIMTWVVGTPTFFGYAILVSDIRVTVTLPRGQNHYFDCLQKIHPVSKSMLAGFAGSVKIRFRMLGQLEYESAKVSPDEDWVLDIIATTWWPRLARKIFEASEVGEKTLGSQIIIAAGHPDKNMGDAPWPQTGVYTFSSPNFEPKKGDYGQVLSIGSPEKRYTDALNQLVADFSFMQPAVVGEFGPGSTLADALKREIAENPLPGISSLFQVGTVSRMKVSVNNFVETRFMGGGERLEDRFPLLACNYEEFVQICQANGFTAEASLC